MSFPNTGCATGWKSVSAAAWILRIGAAGCFIGHGAFGIITKAAWVRYFAVFGIREPWAWRLMPKVGGMDIAIGLLALFWPCRAALLWAAAWSVWTAMLRPLSGESCWEFWERAGNYGVPLALLAIVGPRGGLWSHPFRMRGRSLSGSVEWATWVLRLSVVALLAGHGGCILAEPGASFTHNVVALWAHVPATFLTGIGALEIALAAGVLVRPSAALLVGIASWKLASEGLFLFAGSPIWECIERFGSYTAPLALASMLKRVGPEDLPGPCIPSQEAFTP
jgi:hypothetical protein